MQQLRSFLAVVPLGLALATISASTADAQRRNQIVICRDGTRFESDNGSVCNRHRGVDGRATENARRYEADRVANGRRNGRDDRRDDRDDRRDARDDRRDERRDRRDDRWDDRRDNDPRYDGRNGRGGYDNVYGSGRAPVYEWQGTVDKEIQIQLRGNRAVVQPIGAGDGRGSRGRVVNGLPQRSGTLVVQRLDGRGSVDVIRQPSAANGYTATLRIRDSQGGADHYRIVAYWQSSGNDRWDDRNRFGAIGAN
jgi:hypothetical protein